jgi:2-octaprenyl-6-methoxyphenol hydroxylase
MLANQGIKVDIFSNQKIKKINKNQTLGISKTNINFFNENILNINKFLWNINKIEIFSESLKNDKILNFENNSETLFSIVKNFDLYNYIYLSLNKNKLVKFKKKINYQNLIKKDYKLIFNCDYNHPISKSFFYKKIKKNYNGYAHISVIKHEKLVNNFVASQIFTKKGPLAFLPISSTETSIVFSVKGKKDIDFVNLIKKYNNRYNIFKMTKSLSFELKSSNLRTYHHGNIIAFGDLLHKLHPLAGQGFNMTIRDIKKILELIKFKKEHGLDLDKSICKDFERNTKSKNYLFANSIDFIYEFFNFENKIRNNTLSKSVRFLGKNKMINKFFTNLADAGISI